MITKYIFPVLIILALSIVSSLASAQTMVAGKVYNSDYSSTIEGATIDVKCNSYSLTTTSLADGTYAVRFAESECTLGDNVNVVSNKGELTGSGSGIVAECEDNCQEDYFVIANLAMKQKPSSPGGSSGGSSGRVYICGNGKCDSGETAITCKRDCEVKTNLTVNNNETNQTEPIALNGTEPVSFGVTGASVAWEEFLSLPLFVSLLVFLVILLIGHKMIQKRKSKVEF